MKRKDFIKLGGALLMLTPLTSLAPSRRSFFGPKESVAGGGGGGGPTFVQEAESVWDTTAAKTTGSFTVQNGDVLVCIAVCEGAATFSTPTNTNTAFDWALQENINVADRCELSVWTTTATAGQSMTVSVDETVSGGWFGMSVLTFRGSSGVGAAENTNAADGAPSLSITTTAANSALVVVNADYEAGDGASRTWRTVNSITPTSGNGLELTYFRDAAHYTVYIAYYNDVGGIGAKTVGMTVPSGQDYSIAAVEIKSA